MDSKVMNIIEEINAGMIKIYKTKEESIISLIEYYSFDDYKNIFEEFIEDMKAKKNYKTTLYEYVENTYQEKIVQLEEIYFVGMYDYLEKESIEKLLKVISSNNIEDIIEFCENYS